MNTCPLAPYTSHLSKAMTIGGTPQATKGRPYSDYEVNCPKMCVHTTMVAVEMWAAIEHEGGRLARSWRRRNHANRARRKSIQMKLEQWMPRSKKIGEGVRQILSERSSTIGSKPVVGHVPPDGHYKFPPRLPGNLSRESSALSAGGTMKFRKLQQRCSCCICPLTTSQGQGRGKLMAMVRSAFSRRELTLE